MAFTFFRNGQPVISSTGNDYSFYAEQNPDCVLVMELCNEDHYYKDGQVHKRQSAPSDLYVFDYAAGQWVQDVAKAGFEVRKRRNKLLLESDWTETPSAAQRLGPQLVSQWQTYRQALRDITEQDLFNITWPTPPGD